MNAEQIQSAFRQSLAQSIELLPEGVNRYQVFTPFHFDDGDHFVIVLKEDGNGGLLITDEGHTYMHLSYRMPLSRISKGPRNQIIESALDRYGVFERQGQIFMPIKEIGEAGNALYNFVQCLMQISDVLYLNRERAASTFMEDFMAFLSESVPAERLQFDYREKSHDPEGKYRVDCRINGAARPLHVYGIGSDNKCKDVNISILQFQKWDIPFRTLAVFEDQENIGRKVLSRFTDVCDRQFSSLGTNKSRIREFLIEQMKE